MRGDWSGTCTCTCNPCTYVFHNVGMFSIMQLGPERGVGVAIAKAVATEQQDCGTCIYQLGNCVLKSLMYSNTSLLSTMVPTIPH